MAVDVDVVAVQYPGREDRLLEEPLSDLSAVADGAFDALRPWLDSHTCLLGHSMGAIVAFEVARRVECAESVTGPGLLIASACEAPSRVPRWDAGKQDDESLLAELSSLGGTTITPDLDEELLSIIMPTIRADLRAVEQYHPPQAAVVGAPVVAILGDQDLKVSPGQAADWANHTKSHFSLRSMPGDHFYLMADTERFAAEVADCLAEFIG